MKTSTTRPRFSPDPTRRGRLGLEPLGDRILPAGILVVGTDAGPVATVRTFIDTDGNGTYETLADDFNPYGGFTGGVRVATGDFDEDGNDELVTAMGAGGNRVKVWALNSDGTVGGLINWFDPFGGFVGGLFVAAGDVDGDGRDELALARASAGSTVRIYSDTDHDGLLSDNPTDSFNAFGGFMGGVRLAFGDTNDDGGDELILAQGPGGGTVWVATDSDGDLAVSGEFLLESFFAFGAAYAGGVYVAAGDTGLGGPGAEVFAGRDAGGVSTVRMFTDDDADGMVGDTVMESFQAFNAGFVGGVRLAAGDTDQSGTTREMITAHGTGGNRVVIRDDDGDAGTLFSDNAAEDNFQPFGAAYNSGLFVAFAEVENETYALEVVPVGIPDSPIMGVPGINVATILVPPGAGAIADLDVSLAVAHTAVGNLNFVLTHVPSGTAIALFTGIGGTDAGLFARLDDEADTDIGDADNPADEYISGTYNPEGAAELSDFDGLDASGTWVLTMQDSTMFNTGALYGWSLHFRF